MVDHRIDYRQLWRQTVLRLLVTYFAPLVLLTVYFHAQYRSLGQESSRRQLLSIAEHQGNTLDLFLRERVVNLTNLIEDPRLPARPSEGAVRESLARLRRDSDTFVDLGFFDVDGSMLSYAGPFPALLHRTYENEAWFTRLRSAEQRFVITDMYSGFRRRPHFTIAVRPTERRGPVAVRATLDPQRLYEYIGTLGGSADVRSVLVNASGSYQTLDLPLALAKGQPPLLPPRTPKLGNGDLTTTDGTFDYAYCWLGLTGWALVTVAAHPGPTTLLGGLDFSLAAISAGVLLAVLSTVLVRATQVVRHRRKEDAARRELSGQLHHAARLASVGELAAGVAHEINNPLAVIAEESGVLRDMMDPRLGQSLRPEELQDRLEAIHDAVFRARDITRKLLSFVRKTEVQVARHDINEIVEDAISGLLEREMSVSNIQVVRRYTEGLPRLLADRGQLEQVIVNLITNAIDAMPTGGRLTVTTEQRGDAIHLSVADTGVGIAPSQTERIFLPFHTTKEVCKGTGLGLSVSCGIINSYGGDIVVDSTEGEGSTFTVVLPSDPTKSPERAEA